MKSIFLRVATLVALTLTACSSSTNGDGSGITTSTNGTGSTTSKSIGASGGTVSLQGASLTIPAGALSGDETISITSTKESPPSGVTSLSPVFSFGPSGITFKVPITVQLDFTSGGTDPVVVWSDNNPTGFATVPTSISGDVASGKVTHFSEGFVADSATIGSIPTGGTDGGTSTGPDAGSGPDASVGDGGGPAIDGGGTGHDASSGGGDSSTGGGDSSTGGGDSGTGGHDGGSSTGDSAGGSCAVCSSGICAGACPAGETTCAATGNTCIDTSTDSSNCGACGKACPSGEACDNGVCATACGEASAGAGCAGTGMGIPECATDCPQQPDLCGTSCFNFQNDHFNCGGCGIACSTGEMCSSGVCVGVCATGDVCSVAVGVCASSCPSGETACGPAGATPFCTSTETDSNNCGSCGKACANGQVCSSGTCVTACNEASAGTACATTGMGVPDCATDCPMQPDLCNNNCFNLQSDQFNCGSCGNVCGMGSTCTNGACTARCPGTEVCSSGGACMASCPSGTKVCGAVASGATGTCVDVTSNDSNCGACGNACAAGEVCLNSGCVAGCGETSHGTDAGVAPMDSGVGP